MPPTSLRDVLQASALLVGQADLPSRLPGPSRPRESLASVLKRRLEALPTDVVSIAIPSDTSEHQCQRATAHAATQLLRQVYILAEGDSAQSAPSSSRNAQPQAPLFSVKDAQVLGMLAGIIGRWGIGLSLDEGVLPASSSKANHTQRCKIEEVIEGIDENDIHKEEQLVAILRFLLDASQISPSLSSGRAQLALVVRPQVMTPVCAGLIQVNHHSVSPSSSWAAQALDEFCKSHAPSLVISNFLALLSSGSAPAWLRASASSRLSAQLPRPGGVRALLLIVIGPGAAAGGDDEVGIKKLDMVSRLLSAKPSGQIQEEVYFTSIVDQLLAIVHAAVDVSLNAGRTSAHGKGKQTPNPLPGSPPESILRAAVFALSHLVLAQAPVTLGVARTVLLSNLHGPLLPAQNAGAVEATDLLAPVEHSDSDSDIRAPLVQSRLILRSLMTLSTIMLYAPPLPGLLSIIIRPVVPALISLVCFTSPEEADSSPKVSVIRIVQPDPRFGDEVQAILETWARSERSEDAVKGVWRAIEAWEAGRQFGSDSREDGTPDSRNFVWAWDDEGGACIRRQHAPLPEASTNLRVDAANVVRWLKSVERKELSGGLFLRWLDEVQELRKHEGLQAAKRSVTRLQLVLQMVEELGSDILTEPTQIIAFVAHALEADQATPWKAEQQATSGVPARARAESPDIGIKLSDLKFVDDDAIERAEHEKDDTEEQPVIPGLGHDEMAMTALTLLLAVLEAHENLTMSNTPLLALTFAKLDALAATDSELVPPLAREAKMVLSLRRASAFAGQRSDSQGEQGTDILAASRATYQEALKSLQDPILPVRAHGLAQLRTLVRSPEAFLSTDPALLPAVLDIFVQALEDEDSFMYLNAVQGLSSLADVYGKQVVRRLVGVYLGGNSEVARREVGSGEKGRRELDKRLRMGEALVQVVQRAGEALGAIVDDLVPPLLFILRTSTLPTPLRSSALTIIATTFESSPLALLPHADMISEACVTLLSVESRPLQPRRRQPEADNADTPETTSNSSSALPQAKSSEPSSHTGDPDDDDEEEEAEFASSTRAAAASLGLGNLASSTGEDLKLKQQRRPEETPDPVHRIDSKHPALRRAAILVLGLIWRAAAAAASASANQQQHLRADHQDQAQAQVGQTFSSMLSNTSIPLVGGFRMPGTARTSSTGRSTSMMLLSHERRTRMHTVLRYLHETDEDSLVRYQAGEVLDEMLE